MHFCFVFSESAHNSTIFVTSQLASCHSESLLHVKKQYLFLVEILCRFETVHQSPSSEELECPWRSFSMIRLLEGALVISVKVDVPFETWRMTVQDARSSMWKPAWRWTSCWRTESAVWSPKNCNKKNTCSEFVNIILSHL